ncbi:MAG: helix-turn-helix domain-containing protein [Steroidobacteraceae bacterium]
MNTRTSGPLPGGRLRGAREAKSLTVEAAAERLRLSPALVRAMEEDHLALLGAQVFARGYLRNYAALLGLPEDEILASFGIGEIPEPSFLPAMELRPKVRDHTRWAWPIAAVLLAIAVVAAFWWWSARA